MKNPVLVVSLASLLCFTFACQNKAEKAELERFRTQAKVEEQNKALVKRWVEEQDQGNLDKFLEFISPDFLWYDPSNNPNPMSKEETYQFLVEDFKLFKEMNHRIEEIVAVDDKVIVRYVIHAIHEGEFQGIPVTGKEVKFSGIAIFQINDGIVTEVREEADKLGWFQQLGMELKLKEAKK